MDLNPIGKHCALQSCNVLDFLPIQCSCSEWFCRLHISPDLHHCSSLHQRPSESSSSTSARSNCALLGCNNPSLEAGGTVVDQRLKEGQSCGTVQRGCPGCQLSFCVHHRHMQSHSCTSLTISKVDTKHEVARAIFTKKVLAPGTPTSHAPVVRQRGNLPPNSQRLVQLQKLNLMKLRHKAVPGDPKDRGSMVSVDQRLHVTVRLAVIGQSAKEIALWFRKTTIAGRALDLIVQHFGISNTASTFYLKQSSAEIGVQVLQNHLELSGQLEDGSTIVLTNSPSSG